jgi:hypothetical protein
MDATDYISEEIAAGTNMNSEGTHNWVEMVDSKHIFSIA